MEQQFPSEHCSTPPASVLLTPPPAPATHSAAAAGAPRRYTAAPSARAAVPAPAPPGSVYTSASRADRRNQRRASPRHSLDRRRSAVLSTTATCRSRFAARAASTAPSAVGSVAAAIRIRLSFGCRVTNSATSLRLFSSNPRLLIRTKVTSGSSGDAPRIARNAPKPDPAPAPQPPADRATIGNASAWYRVFQRVCQHVCPAGHSTVCPSRSSTRTTACPVSGTACRSST